MAPERAELLLERRDEWLIARGLGVVTIGWLLTAINTIGQALKEQATEGVLVDLSEMEGSLADLERYQAGVESAKQAAYLPVAFVSRPRFMDQTRLGETVARNRGVNVRVFDERGPAEAWLKAEVFRRRQRRRRTPTES